MRWIVVAFVCIASVVHAQPVSFQLKLEVPAGQKPQIRITGATQVTGVKLELERDDGKHFTLEQRSLARNQAVTLAVGDGTAGKASYKGTISAQQPAWSDCDPVRHRRAADAEGRLRRRAPRSRQARAAVQDVARRPARRR